MSGSTDVTYIKVANIAAFFVLRVEAMASSRIL